MKFYIFALFNSVFSGLADFNSQICKFSKKYFVIFLFLKLATLAAWWVLSTSAMVAIAVALMPVFRSTRQINAASSTTIATTKRTLLFLLDCFSKAFRSRISKCTIIFAKMKKSFAKMKQIRTREHFANATKQLRLVLKSRDTRTIRW